MFFYTFFREHLSSDVPFWSLFYNFSKLKQYLKNCKGKVPICNDLFIFSVVSSNLYRDHVFVSRDIMMDKAVKLKSFNFLGLL